MAMPMLTADNCGGGGAAGAALAVALAAQQGLQVVAPHADKVMAVADGVARMSEQATHQAMTPSPANIWPAGNGSPTSPVLSPSLALAGPTSSMAYIRRSHSLVKAMTSRALSARPVALTKRRPSVPRMDRSPSGKLTSVTRCWPGMKPLVQRGTTPSPRRWRTLTPSLFI